MKLLTRSIIFLFFVINASLSYSQDFWEEIDFPYNSDIYSITVDGAGIIYLGCENGVYSSEDNGDEWYLILSDGIIHSMTHYGNTVYAGGNINQYTDKYWRSENNGNTWDTIHTNLNVYGNVMAQLIIGDTMFSSIWTDMSKLIRSYDYGLSWELVYSSETVTDYISDIAITEEQIIYFGIKSYGANMGGVHKSTDFGETWEFAGLQYHNVSSMAINSNDDVFVGVRGGEQGAVSGLYVLRSGEIDWDTLLIGPKIESVVINSNDDIYCTSSYPNGVLRSLDDGGTFTYVNNGLPVGPMGYMSIDDDDYIYLTSHYSSSFLARSINPTVHIQENRLDNNSIDLSIFPSPAKEVICLNFSDETFFQEILNINILDIYGHPQEFDNINTSLRNNKLDVSSLLPGIYIVCVKSRNSIIKSKFIKL